MRQASEHDSLEHQALRQGCFRESLFHFDTRRQEKLNRETTSIAHRLRLPRPVTTAQSVRRVWSRSGRFSTDQSRSHLRRESPCSCDLRDQYLFLIYLAAIVSESIYL